MAMKLFDNIFASAYRYNAKRYEHKRSVFRSIMIVEVHVFGLLLLMVAIVKKAFNLNFYISNRNTHLGLDGAYLLVFLFVMFIFIRYFSENKIENILNAFGMYKASTRRAWGIFTIAAIILEYVTMAFLLAK